MITTTLTRIKEHSPCEDGWKKLLKHLNKTRADDEPLPYSVIVESNGLDDALWCCRAEPQHHKEWRLFAVWCCVQIKHLMKDSRSLEAVEVAEKHAHGKATNEELAAAGDAAGDARDAAGDARDAAWDAARAAWAAARAARDAAGDARDAAWDAARAARAAWAAARAAWAAARAARAAAGDARDAAGDARDAAGDARDAAGDAQKEEFLRVLANS